MRDVIVAEALHTLQDHARGLVADRAVCRILNDTGGFLDQVDGLERGGRVEHFLQQGGQLPEPDAAGHALATGLCVAQAQEGERHIDRAEPRRAGADAVFHVAVQAFDNGLRPSRRFDGQSAQRGFLLLISCY